MEEHCEPKMTEDFARAIAELEARATPEMWAAARRMMEGIQRGDPEFTPRVGRWVEVPESEPGGPTDR